MCRFSSVHLYYQFQQRFVEILSVVASGRNAILFRDYNSMSNGLTEPCQWSIGTTWPIPPNRRSILGCIRWKDMSNPKRLRWYIVLTETYESRSAITKDISFHLINPRHDRRLGGIGRVVPIDRKTWRRFNNAQSELLGQFRLNGDRAK